MRHDVVGVFYGDAHHTVLAISAVVSRTTLALANTGNVCLCVGHIRLVRTIVTYQIFDLRFGLIDF